jgi:hypothetical protein
MSKIIADLSKDTSKKINLYKINDSVDIYGFKDPKIVIQEGRNFMIVKEGRQIKTFNDFKNLKDRKDKYKNKDIGIVFTGDNDKKIDFHDNITDKLYSQSYFGGGNNFYDKYLKYKTKYIELKKSLNLVN